MSPTEESRLCSFLERRLAAEVLPALARVAEEALDEALKMQLPAHPEAVVNTIARAVGIDSEFVWIAVARERGLIP